MVVTRKEHWCLPNTQGLPKQTQPDVHTHLLNHGRKCPVSVWQPQLQACPTLAVDDCMLPRRHSVLRDRLQEELHRRLPRTT